MSEQQETRGERITYPTERERLTETEHLYAACLAQLDAAKAIILQGTESAWTFQKRAEAAEARAAELERTLEKAIEREMEAARRGLLAEREAAETQAHAARLANLCLLAAPMVAEHATIYGDESLDEAMVRVATATPTEAPAYLRALEAFIVVYDVWYKSRDWDMQTFHAMVYKRAAVSAEGAGSGT